MIMVEGNGLPAPDDQLYLAGDTFLAHFYTAYNFDDNTISIGVNSHSEGLANIKTSNEDSENVHLPMPP